MDKGLAAFIALIALGLVVETVSWLGGLIDAWISGTKSQVGLVVVGLTVYGGGLLILVAGFLWAVRWLPSLATP